MDRGKLTQEQCARHMGFARTTATNICESVRSRLAERFHVSGVTIRLDLSALEQTGEIVRTHGGAVLTELTVREPRISERAYQSEKARIAQKALAHLDDGVDPADAEALSESIPLIERA